MQNTEGKIRAAIEKYQLIEENDRIAVGVSGGKDSLALLYYLSKLRAYYPSPFFLTAITVDPCFENRETDYSAVSDFCEELHVPYVLRRSRLGSIIFEERAEQNPCSLCARMRRGILHNMAKEQNCNKIALGHHFDDAVQTFFMNLFYGGSISCFSPKTYLSNKDLTLIRPLIFCEEQELSSAASVFSFPVVKSRCPADGVTCRKDTADLIKLLEKDFPDLKSKVMGAMQRAGIDGWARKQKAGDE